jgi:hypothetical protein
MTSNALMERVVLLSAAVTFAGDSRTTGGSRVGRTGAASGPRRRTHAHEQTYAFEKKDSPLADWRAAVLGRELGHGLGQSSILGGDVVLERHSVANERQLLARRIELVLFGEIVRNWCWTRRTLEV